MASHPSLVRVAGHPRLACEVAGTGPPVFFLHGIGGNRTNWHRQVAHLADRFTAISWDARGYGDSDDYDEALDFEMFGDDLARALDHFEVERAHLVGLSMGARIVMNFVSRYPRRAATLTLCDCFYGFDASLTPDKQEEYVALRERPLRSGKTFADLAPRLVESLVSPTASAAARQELTESVTRLRTEPYLKTLRAGLTFDESATIGDIDVPVQLIFGADDRLTPPSIGQDMAERIADTRLDVIPGAGHLSNLEAPTAFNGVLAKFLDQHRDAARFRTAGD